MFRTNIEIGLDGDQVGFGLRFLARHGTGRPAQPEFRFLHEVRSPRAAMFQDFGTSEAAYRYFRALSRHVQGFAALLGGIECDIIATPPSRRQDADPYVATARTAFRDADIVPRSCFAKTGHAGDCKSVMEFLPHLTFQYTGDLRAYGSLLIIDDVYSSGITAGAMIYRLRENGFPVTTDITVACPLWAHDNAFNHPVEAISEP